MGWFKNLTGFSTPKFLKDFDDNVFTPAVNTIAAINPEYKAMYQGAKAITHSAIGGSAVKQSTIKSDVKSQAQIIQENLENQLKREYEEKKKELDRSIADMKLNQTVKKEKDDSNSTLVTVLGLATAYLFF